MYPDFSNGMICYSVFNIMKTWLEVYYHDEEDAGVLNRIEEFASKVMMEVMAKAANIILKLVDKRVSYDLFA